MNTNLRDLGKSLSKKALKKIKGGTPEETNSTGQMDLLCPGAFGNCKLCTASSTNGSGITYSFSNTNLELVNAWETVWRNFGYRVECTMALAS